MRVKHAPGKQNGTDALKVLWPRYLSTFGLDHEVHVHVDMKGWVMVVGSLAKKIIEYVAKGAATFLRVRVCLVSLED